MRGSIRPIVMGLMLFALAGCSFFMPTPTPKEVVPPAAKPLGPADIALQKFLPVDAFGNVRGGPACKAEDLGAGGGQGSSDRAWILSCPRVGIDRTVYFTIADAIDGELHRIATVPHSSNGSGDATNDALPPWNFWDVRGETNIGVVRTIGIPGPGNLTIVVSLDLIAP